MWRKISNANQELNGPSTGSGIDLLRRKGITVSNRNGHGNTDTYPSVQPTTMKV